MFQTVINPKSSMTQTSMWLEPFVWVFVWFGLALLFPAFIIDVPIVRISFIAVSSSMFSMAFLVTVIAGTWTSPRHYFGDLAIKQGPASRGLAAFANEGIKGEIATSDTSSMPRITVSKSGSITRMNSAMSRLVGSNITHLDRICRDLPLRNNSIHAFQFADQHVDMHVMILSRNGKGDDIYLHPTDTESHRSADLSNIFDGLPVAMVRISAAGNVLVANRMARHLLGHSMNSGPHFGDLVKGLGRSVEAWLQEGLQGRTQNKPEVVEASKTDTEVYLQVSLTRIVEDGENCLIAVLNDATELKTLEAQFVQSQKMQAIGQLAGGIAHDFNNLLTAISGYCDLLLLRHTEKDTDFGDLIQISQNANRAASLVGQLLAFSRKQSLQPEILDLRDTLSDLSHLLSRLLGEQVSMAFENPQHLSLIRADKRQLEQVIMNLVVNARDAMPGGGVVKIETEDMIIHSDLRRDRALIPKGRYVRIKVTDHGTGIASDKISKIFEPFFTTKRAGEGTGLGLSTAYGIVKQSGGYIFVTSAIGVGTEFTLMFPVYATTEPERVKNLSPRVQVPNELFGDGVVLLVEDEAPVRAFAARALRMRGFTVLEAENAEDALSQLEDENLKIDVFVSDVIMPGMDGPTWVRKALKNRPDVKVIFVSGYAENAFSEHGEKIPNSVFLPKPFSLNELTNKVVEQVH